MAATATRTRTVGLTVDRKELTAALQRAAAVIPSRTAKPIFAAVRLSNENEWLRIDATDGEIQFTTRIEAHGKLPAIVVSCRDLLARIKSGKQTDCSFAVKAKPARLIVNGGAVEHTLQGLDLGDFPPTAEMPTGKTMQLETASMRSALSLAGAAASRELSRFGLNGVLFESDDQGARFVGTDGRRLALGEISPTKLSWVGKVVLPARFGKLVERFAAGETAITWSIADRHDAEGAALPAEVHVGGESWQLATLGMEGSFPNYRDVQPISGSRFAIERKSLIEAIRQVALATDLESRAVQLSLGPKRVEVAAHSAESGASSAKLPCRFLGGGDSSIKTGFNPQFILDALKTLPGDTVILDLQQNGLADGGVVVGKPCILSVENNATLRWVVMPISIGLLPTRENLGSNFKEPAADAA